VAEEGEFDRIARLFRPLARKLPGALGLTDDVGFLPPAAAGEALIVTTDTVVEGIHVLPGASPLRMAEKVLRVNLSDLASKGARPLAVLLNTALPHELPAGWLDAFAQALGRDLDRFGAGLLGGDSVATTGPVTLTLTAIGSVPEGLMPRRSGARVGDTIWVSGTLGDGALGLRAARGDLPGLSGEDASWLADRYHRPQPRLALGRALLGTARAGMDLSDGLPGDLVHICRASGVGATVDLAALPLSDAARRAIALQPALERRAWAGGDDYELLFTAAAVDEQAVREAGTAAGCPVTPIGRIVEGSGPPLFLDRTGHPVEGLRGWTHF
jgi:thiamine-monophosphate kinase